MPSRLLPLFPLEIVVFPRTRVPLHIFEERYKEMVGAAIVDGSEFGIVLAKEEGIVNVGCTVTVEKVLKRYPDGRMDILTRGNRRFEILFLDEQKTYLRAEVQFFDDDEGEPPPPAAREKVLAQYADLAELGEVRAEPDLNDPQLSFQLAQNLPDSDFLHLLLRSKSERDRMREIGGFLERFLPRQRRIQKMKGLAPLNGFGGPYTET